MEWTRDMKYRRIEDMDTVEYKKLKLNTENAPWRQQYHIQPVTGLLNDPNGFVYHNGQYHLFYQWFPLGAVHGMKYWFHLVSEDLVYFEADERIVEPDTTYDSHGAYSGSALVVDDEVKLIYTGNHRTENWERIPYQIIAALTEDGVVKAQPFIEGAEDGYTEHFRDPKVWKMRDKYYAVIGAQRKDLTGTIVVYSSDDFKTWTFEGELKTAYQNFGYMWECPDYFELEGIDVVLFCPQGVSPKGNQFRNIYQSGYIIGNINFNDFTMEHDAFTELDNGFDFYAPQTTVGKDGERILIGWMGLPDIQYPTDKDEWAHCLTLPRVLTIEEGKLMQRPIKALANRRLDSEEKNIQVFDEQNVFTGKCYELLVNVEAISGDALLIDLRASNNEYTRLRYDAEFRAFTLDRTHSGLLPEGVDGTTRTTLLSKPLKALQIFVDESSIEVFVNDGAHVFTSRIFPSEHAEAIRVSSLNGSAQLSMMKFNLKEGIS
ncbi:glycoside hydrolase family 32 protein [Macrococcus armenti]|uniref:Sucrose-6-phosphate hydrolase n=1 Tax=Macrococcus armenti TaxID=2875764 RepID=A0ABY3ZWI8_9STAP|nr:sucrose-6-phosphate hydrolase [Macrococcus armenti]UOB20917.1 sucrose-6-phosphate hydrolase [Macrococcus armenti]